MSTLIQPPLFKVESIIGFATNADVMWVAIPGDRRRRIKKATAKLYEKDNNDVVTLLFENCHYQFKQGEDSKFVHNWVGE